MTITTHPASMTTEQRDQFTGTITDVIRGVGESFAIFHYTNTAGMLCAIAFYGKALKPALRYSFRSAELRVTHCNDWMGGVMRAQGRTAERRAQRNQPHTLAVGDVLRSMWGYEQTNIDYYEVTARHGRTQVTLRAEKLLAPWWATARRCPAGSRVSRSAARRWFEQQRAPVEFPARPQNRTVGSGRWPACVASRSLDGLRLISTAAANASESGEGERSRTIFIVMALLFKSTPYSDQGYSHPRQ